METFKAVEKEMKTKAFSKEGLNAAAKLDPKEKERQEMSAFLQDTIDELARQLESNEAESETLTASAKKSKKDGPKTQRLQQLETSAGLLKWHTGKLEILLRSLENGSVEVEQVKEIEDGIKYFVENNSEADYVDDEGLYDELNLEDEEDLFGMSNENDKVSSQDAQSIQDEPPDTEGVRISSVPGGKAKPASTSEVPASGRRPSVQLKSPLPALSSLHPISGSASGKQPDSMKPAPLPTIPTGQPLKYASAAAAAAASDKNGVGIAPLPPPPGTGRLVESPSPAASQAPLHASSALQESESNAPRISEQPPKQPTPVPKEEPTSAEAEVMPTTSSSQVAKQISQATQAQPSETGVVKLPQPPSPDSGIAGLALSYGEPAQEDNDEDCIYHLPSSLMDLLDSFEETRQRAKSDQAFDLAMLETSRHNRPLPLDAEKPNHYKPQHPYAYTPAHYPQEPLQIFDDPRLYGRIDTDSLFYAFYYRQGTYQQYLAAKALKSQSWRFHKQYQTWFQRHEEPKNITEEFEQGTYRFFDYESTW